MLQIQRHTKQGSLEHGEETALSEAICVFAHVHDRLALDCLGHSCINKLINGTKASCLDHFSNIILRRAVVTKRKSVQQERLIRHMWLEHSSRLDN